MAARPPSTDVRWNGGQWACSSHGGSGTHKGSISEAAAAAAAMMARRQQLRRQQAAACPRAVALSSSAAEAAQHIHTRTAAKQQRRQQTQPFPPHVGAPVCRTRCRRPRPQPGVQQHGVVPRQRLQAEDGPTEAGAGGMARAAAAWWPGQQPGGRLPMHSCGGGAAPPSGRASPAALAAAHPRACRWSNGLD